MISNPGVVCIPARGPHSTSADLYARTEAVDPATVVVLDVATPFAKVGLVRFKMKYVSGTGVNFTPLIFSKAGVTTSGDIAQEYEGAATVNADLFDPQLADAPVWMQCDEHGRLYMLPVPDDGSDNLYDYCLRFLKGE